MIQLSGPGMQQLLIFNREELQAGQWYRLLSCHWVHLDWEHTGMNVIGLWLLCLIDTSAPRFWASALRCLWLSIAVGMALFVLQPTLHWYVGFSGVLHGLFVIALIDMVWQQRDRFALVVLVILMGKLVWEHYHGALSQGMLDAPVIVAAHSYGALAGLAYSVVAALTVFTFAVREKADSHKNS